MIVELVTFHATPGADWNAIPAEARATIPRWRANAQLVRKHYLLSEDGTECAGLYIWPTRAAAEAAHDAAWRAAVAQRTGSVPAIQYLELQMLLDNEAGTVTKWAKNGSEIGATNVLSRQLNANHQGARQNIANALANRIVQSFREFRSKPLVRTPFLNLHRRKTTETDWNCPIRPVYTVAGTTGQRAGGSIAVTVGTGFRRHGSSSPHRCRRG